MKPFKTLCSAVSAVAVAASVPAVPVSIALMMAAAPGSASAACRYVVGPEGHGDGVICDPEDDPVPAPLKWAAIAVSTDNRAAGISWAYPSKQAAAAQAWRSCAVDSPNCKVVMTATLCIALARNDAETNTSWASDYTLASARSHAMANCNSKRLGRCEIILQGCP